MKQVGNSRKGTGLHQKKKKERKEVIVIFTIKTYLFFGKLSLAGEL